MTCDFSGTGEPVIKGNVGSGGEKIYHTPLSPFYDRTKIDESQGERMFCTEEEAIAAGWRPPLRSSSEPTPGPTASPAPQPTATPRATATSAPTVAGPDVRITCVFFDGVVSSQEPDEYVQIANLGDEGQDLGGWTLLDVSDGKPEFRFPTYMLEPGAVVRVYTNQVHPQWGGFSFERGSAIWSNSDPDSAGLYDRGGSLVSTRSYPPGCE